MKNLNVFNLLAMPPESPLTVEQPPIQPAKRRFGKKLYAVLAVLVIVIIVSAAFFIPQGTTATIPLKVDYVVGEKMVYDSTVTVNFDLGSSLGVPLTAPNSTTMNIGQTIEVTGFDGENYFLNHTMTMNVLDRPVSVSMIEKMNKTGYSTYLLDLGSIQQEIPSNGLGSNTFLAQLLSKPEVKVGDTVTIPFPSIGTSQYVQTTGDLTMKFSGVEDLTVPAGTYRVFKIDITSNNLKMTLNTPTDNSTLAAIPTNLSMNLDLNYQIYLEYGTLRQIKSTMQETAGFQSSILNMTAQMGMDMTLTQHIKP